MKKTQWLSWNSETFTGRELVPETWDRLKGQVDSAVRQFQKDGGVISRISFKNEVNEVTPHNQDRELFYFRINAVRTVEVDE